MSTAPEPGFNLEDLERHFLPAWARQSPATNRYAKFEGGEEVTGPRHRERGDRRGGPWPERRPGGEGGGPRRSFGDRPRGPRREGGGGRPERREERREPVVPLPELGVTFVPDEKGVESLARQIKLTGRAYPMFEIGQLVLRKPERYHVTFSVLKKVDGSIAQQLWLCNLDDTLWLNEADAVDHVLRKHFATFYQAEKTPTEPPKGTYTFVAQCSLSGVILGPPNFHDYQAKLHKLHAARFARMPFEVYKARIRIVRDEAVVKQWVDEQSWKTEYVCLNVPEAVRLATREEVEKHFREVHLANILRPVESSTLSGPAAQALPTPALRTLVRRAWEEQQRFPLRVVHTLSQQFAAHGLQFFKVNRTVTHVSVARPHYLDLSAAPVSENIRRIVEFIDAKPGCNRKRLLEGLAPAPPSATPPPVAAPEAAPEGAPAAAAAEPPEAPREPQPTPEQTALIADLHWLVHQGHVIEFANGRLETARKPKPRPAPPVPPATPVAAPPVETVSAPETAPSAVESAAPVNVPEAAPSTAESPAPAAEEPVSSPTATDAAPLALGGPAEPPPAEGTGGDEGGATPAPADTTSPEREPTPEPSSLPGPA